MIGVTTQFPELVTKAKALAEKLGLPFSENIQAFKYVIIITHDDIGLKKVGEKSHPFYVDFLSGKIAYRQKTATIRKEAIARAFGLKKNTRPTIVDATGGLARDSFIIASLGFEVTVLERSPILFTLIQDGMERASKNETVAPVLQRMHLIQADANDWLKHSTKPEIIYLDPMFPLRKKSSLVKKEMRILQDIVGEDPDAESLLQTALACAASRVVVKRPRLAAALSTIIPSFSIEGSSSRFDVYLIRNI